MEKFFEIFKWLDEEVNVIGHDDIVAQMVAFVVEELEGVSNDLRVLWFTKGAGAVALVQCLMEGFSEEGAILFLVPSRKFVGGFDVEVA